MNAIQLHLHAENLFNKYCAVCYQSAKKGRTCYPMRRAKATNIKGIENSYMKYAIEENQVGGYWSCFREE